MKLNSATARLDAASDMAEGKPKSFAASFEELAKPFKLVTKYASEKGMVETGLLPQAESSYIGEFTTWIQETSKAS